MLSVISERNLVFLHLLYEFNYVGIGVFNKNHRRFLRVVSWYVHIIRTFWSILQYVYIVHTILISCSLDWSVYYYYRDWGRRGQTLGRDKGKGNDEKKV